MTEENTCVFPSDGHEKKSHSVCTAFIVSLYACENIWCTEFHYGQTNKKVFAVSLTNTIDLLQIFLQRKSCTSLSGRFWIYTKKNYSAKRIGLWRMRSFFTIFWVVTLFNVLPDRDAELTSMKVDKSFVLDEQRHIYDSWECMSWLFVPPW